MMHGGQRGKEAFSMKERSYKLIQGDMKKGNAKEYSVENGKHR